MDDSIFNLEYSDSIPLLTKAVRAGDLEKVKKLIKQGLPPQTPDNRGWTAIHCCVAENQIKALKLLLKLLPDSKKYLVNLTTWESVTPLHIAIKAAKPCVKMVKILLEAGADLNLCTHTKLSPLHLACMKKGNYQLVKLLVEYGADVNIQEEVGLFTPLNVAICSNSDLKVIKYLINLSDLSLKNANDRTAFLEACNSNYLKAVEMFLEKDKNLVNIHHGLPPLAYAGIVGNVELTQLLLNSGADVNMRCKAIVPCGSDSESILLDRESFLPIHSSLTNVEVFKLLLKSTNSSDLLKYETNYYSFPLFVIMYGNETFYEVILQSDLPDQLKTIRSKVLVKFIISYPDMEDVVIDKLPVIFKYNFALESECVLRDLISEISTVEFTSYYKIVHWLAQMGISDKYECRQYVINKLENFNSEDVECARVISSTCDMLSKSVLSLKQYSRNAFRKHIKDLVGNDWLILKTVDRLELPDCLKTFLFYGCFR